METFLWSALLMIISALAYVAHEYPASFKFYIGLPLLAIVTFCTILSIAGILSGMNFYISDLVDKIHELQMPTIEFSDDPTAFNSEMSLALKQFDIEKQLLAFSADRLDRDRTLFGLTLMIAGASIVYLLILIFLPQILSLDERGKNDKKDSSGR